MKGKDQTRYNAGLTPHWFGPSNDGSKGEGHPILYGMPRLVHHFDPFPDGGGYPKRFVEWALREMGCFDPDEVLHMCSGSMRSGVRVDVRPEMKPDIVADCRNVPLPDQSFRFIMADPPYSAEYAANLYGTESSYPEPGAIVKEMGRLLKPGGKCALLHFQVPMLSKPLHLMRVYGITTGSGYAIRAWTLMERPFEHPRLEMSV